jgi:Lrp/AsnC family transcriptional regulator for asnA, asnC and gidA
MVQKSDKRVDVSRLLKLLRGNARLSYTELARRLSLSEAAVRKTVKKLIEQGIIAKFLTEYDYKKLNKIEAFIGINTKPEKLIFVVEQLKKDYPQIDIIYLTSGDHDIIVHGVFENLEELEKFCKELEALDGIEAVYPAAIVEKIFKT